MHMNKVGLKRGNWECVAYRAGQQYSVASDFFSVTISARNYNLKFSNYITELSNDSLFSVCGGSTFTPAPKGQPHITYSVFI